MKGTYRTDPSTEAQVTVVEIGDGRHFLVVRFRIREWKTLVLEHQISPDCWISRRDVDGNVDPVDAVTGHLLRQPASDPVSLMKRDLLAERRANWELRNELLRLKKKPVQVVGERKRGKRGRRNP